MQREVRGFVMTVVMSDGRERSPSPRSRFRFSDLRLDFILLLASTTRVVRQIKINNMHTPTS